MSRPFLQDDPPTIGLLGLGAFGRLIALHLAPLASLVGYDPAPADERDAAIHGLRRGDLETVARCAIVVLAVPVGALPAVVAEIAPHLRPGALVVDVGSVKLGPADAMRQGLPDHVDVVGTHPLFGPQSAREGLRGLKIAVCPIRGRRRALRLAAVLRVRLGLCVILTTPDTHDREAATVQGLTHLIAKVLVQMGPLPTRMTTASFDLLARAVEMVRYDAPDVFHAIERANPYAAEVRRRFFDLAAAVDADLAGEAQHV